MSDSSDEQAHTRAGSGDATEHEGVADATGRGDAEGVADREDVEELRRSVEEKYDFEDFGPAQMAEMSAEEWDAAFDPDTWITGSELLDRLEADVKHRVITRDVFARVERIADPDRLVAYSDEGYAVVYPDGSIEGSGTVLRDVKPLVALCSMAEYDPPEMPEGDLLPEPMEVPQGSGEFGNLMVQLVAGAQVLAGLGLLGAFVLTDGGPVVLVAALGFLVIGVTLFVVVANARLSDKFRAEEYRNRLRAVGLESGERPEWLPPEVEFEADGELEESPDSDTA
jgi:hypothetical protein